MKTIALKTVPNITEEQDPTSIFKKQEIAKKFPWIGQFSKNGEPESFRILRVAPPMDPEKMMATKRGSSLYLIYDGLGASCLKVGVRKNLAPRTIIQRILPSLYNETVCFDESLYETVDRVDNVFCAVEIWIKYSSSCSSEFGVYTWESYRNAYIYLMPKEYGYENFRDFVKKSVDLERLAAQKELEEDLEYSV